MIGKPAAGCRATERKSTCHSKSGRQAPVKGIGKLKDSPRLKKILEEKKNKGSDISGH